jgi:hypothetical protein
LTFLMLCPGTAVATLLDSAIAAGSSNSYSLVDAQRRIT